MSEAEIMKALECCGRESCNGCPYRGECHQGNPMIRDALDLINRKNDEIKQKDDEIDCLNKAIQVHQDYEIKKARAEAIKEFGETAAIYTVQYAFDFVRKFIREKTKLDPVYAFNPTEKELNKYFAESKSIMGEIAKEMGVEL